MIPIPRRSATRAGAVAALCGGMLAVTLALGGCSPGTDPKPTPTPLFASEADAYKAAEKVYREYVDATNARNDGDESANPESFMAGIALEQSLESTRARKNAGISVSGHFEMVDFRRVRADLDPVTPSVETTICVDVSGTKLSDQSGQDVTPANRAPRVELNVEFNRSRDGMKIFRADATGAAC